MTTLRTAAQQALEALEEATSYTSCTTWSPSMTEECEAAAAALKAALAEPPTNQCGETCERAKLCAACARELAEPTYCPKCGEEDGWPCGLPDCGLRCGAEPVQEPVAWIYADPDKFGVKFLEWREDAFGYEGEWTRTPLYAAPPQRKPLTEEEIHSLFRIAGSPTEFVRAIERAHGITP